ncbi:hypothetical protein DCC79_01250 [bacterium]|nr:MAG: hypothetical protein DCC79_01250 [bacterium]
MTCSIDRWGYDMARLVRWFIKLAGWLIDAGHGHDRLAPARHRRGTSAARFVPQACRAAPCAGARIPRSVITPSPRRDRRAYGDGERAAMPRGGAWRRTAGTARAGVPP